MKSFLCWYLKVFNQVLAIPDVPSVSQEYDVWCQVQTLQVRGSKYKVPRCVVLLVMISLGCVISISLQVKVPQQMY